jgi:hypothetical protein
MVLGINRFRRFRLFETVFFCYDRCTPFANLVDVWCFQVGVETFL